MNKVELNDNYISKILTEKSPIFEVAQLKDLGDGEWNVVIKDQIGEYFQGKVLKKDDGKYVIKGDSEFDRVYPTLDAKTKKIVSIKHSDSHPPNESA